MLQGGEVVVVVKETNVEQTSIELYHSKKNWKNKKKNTSPHLHSLILIIYHSVTIHKTCLFKKNANFTMGHCGSWSGGPAQLPNKGWQVAEDQMLSKQILDTWGNGENTTAEQEKDPPKKGEIVAWLVWLYL